LYWLIGRTLARRAPDPAQRVSMLAEVRDQLWLSFEQRLRIARGLSDEEPVTRSAPAGEDGIEPERAYFNLAGINLLLARTYHELAAKQEPEGAASLRAQAGEAFGQAEDVYEAVRALREARYRGRAHPHLAACVNGLGLVAYYRATLLDDAALILDAIGYVAAALEQRRMIADDSIGARRAGVLQDADVRKSADLMLKVAIAACWLGQDGPGDGKAETLRIFAEAADELAGGPG
jgi:hypothetical protein